MDNNTTKNIASFKLICSNCNKLNNIISPFSLEAVECEHLLFC